jgi:hypothetical protein
MRRGNCVMDWKTAEEISGTLQNAIASAAVIIGGL